MRRLLVGMLLAGAFAAGNMASSRAATIDACVVTKTGALRIVGSPADCHKSETFLSWSEAGPAGPPGPSGPAVLSGGSGGQGVLAGQENNMGPGNGFTVGPAGIIAVPMPPGSLSHLRVWLSVPANASGSYQFSLCTNPGFGGSCPLSCTISKGAQSCSDASHTATLKGGDRVYVTGAVSGSPSLSSAEWSADFTPSGP